MHMSIIILCLYPHCDIAHCVLYLWGIEELNCSEWDRHIKVYNNFSIYFCIVYVIIMAINATLFLSFYFLFSILFPINIWISSTCLCIVYFLTTRLKKNLVNFSCQLNIINQTFWGLIYWNPSISMYYNALG